MKQHQFFFVEVTDTFGGEANYSWVTRHKIKAKTQRGAVNKLSRDSGMSWRCVDRYSETPRYDSASGATCFFISDWDESHHGEYSRVNVGLAA